MSNPSPNLFVISAPSGAGKTTLVKALVERNPDLRFSVSYTTRQQRSNETEGSDYFFVNKAEFEKLHAQGELLESAMVFDNLYATSRAQVEEHLAAGNQVILEIDWQGARQVRKSMPGCITVFRSEDGTRLNSSHVVISYAVFCLKKKTTIPLCVATL